jgi:methylthioxylose transferase
VVAAVVGRVLLASGTDILLPFPPLLAEWLPHVGPGTPMAVVVAVLVVTRGPDLADRLAWRPLLAAGYATAAAWTMALALVDGWQRGVVARLTSSQEYLHDVPRVPDAGEMLRTFADHILTDRPGFWSTHVGAHPPGALLTFVWLDRLGLGGGGPAGLFVMLVGAAAPVAVAVAARALGAEDLARSALPFGVLLPGAVWVGVSADGMFAGVLAWGVALLAIGAVGRGPRADLAALAAGVLLGWCLYLSYGLVLGGLLALAVLAVTRNVRAGLIAAVGTLAVVGAFTVSGFWWFTGFERVQVIYAASIASTRPYAYFVWANLAAVLFVLGPAVVAAARRAVSLPTGVALLAGAGLAAILLADVSGMSKGEVERIWLPFAVWLTIPCALLPRARFWLAAQAGLALAVNHLLLTVW